jgi:hypothetical protein
MSELLDGPSQAPSKQLQRTVMDKLPRQIRQRAGADVGR